MSLITSPAELSPYRVPMLMSGWKLRYRMASSPVYPLAPAMLTVNRLKRNPPF